MRSLKRQQQDVWFSKIHERLDGIDTIQEWDKPIMVKMVCSVTSGTPEEIAAGIVPDYDRYVTYHKNSRFKNPLPLEEGMAVWVDVTPELDENGSLVMEDDGVTPITPPDYTLKRILDTKKGDVSRYGIVRLKEAE